MGFFSDDSDQAQAYQQYNGGADDPNQAKWSHELIAGAAAYEADRAYEKHCEQNGQPASHDEAKALFAGFAGAFVDREAETRGMDYIDRERVKRDAVNQSSDQIQQSGGW